jgi:hypothetical protein
MLVPTVLARRFVLAPTLEQFHRSVPKVERYCIIRPSLWAARSHQTSQLSVSDDEKFDSCGESLRAPALLKLAQTVLQKNVHGQ